MKLAAIDIGSNSIKLAVVDAAASHSFAVLAREKETVRLGHETLREEFLSPPAIEAAADCIKRFRSIAEARGAERVIATATASVREATNAAEFIDTVERRTGVRVEVLSGIEEARLIGLAAALGCGATSVSLINLDIGGGSTEISLVRGGVPASLFSVKLGAVGLTERFLASDPPKQKELRALREEVRGALERPARELRGASWQRATGTSGTILAVAEALRAAEAKQKSQGAQPAGAEVVLSRLVRFNERMAELSSAERRGVYGLSAQRAEIIIAGGQILEGALRALGINLLRTCDWALREGVIIDFLREFEAESKPPVPDNADPRLRGVHAVGRRFGYEETHAHQVARFAETIFDELAGPASLTRHQRTLLSAAALLHDIGYHIAHEGHHKHALYLIKNSELTGFSEAERDLIANVARYHRGSPPKDKHPDYSTLNQADRETVRRLAAILRVADALDRNHDSRVSELRCVREGQTLSLQLSSERECDRERAAAESKSDMFKEVFDCELALSRERIEVGPHGPEDDAGGTDGNSKRGRRTRLRG
jgi:exopolyphosphatase/guanosine-5'-triphosphate,3'-diphosphate pyrophosphatase